MVGDANRLCVSRSIPRCMSLEVKHKVANSHASWLEVRHQSVPFEKARCLVPVGQGSRKDETLSGSLMLVAVHCPTNHWARVVIHM